jgi:AP-3 complex subunit beta
MSDLGAIGSAGFEAPPPPPTDPLSSASVASIHELIGSGNPNAESHAMKMIVVLMSKGHDVISFASFVAQQVISPDRVTRQLACVFLTHYAEEAPEIVLLSINALQKSLTDPDPIVRASALRALSSIRSEEALPTIQASVAQMIGDPSPYVKKAVAYAVIKAAELAPSEVDGYLPLVERLLADPSPISFSGAIAVYWSLCPDNIEFLHPHFRYICQNLQNFDEFGQVFVIRAMTVYTRYCFKIPALLPEPDPAAGFWDDAGEAHAIAIDHLLLVSAIKKCLASQSAAVVLAAVAYLVYCAPASQTAVVAKPLIRLLYE